MRSLVIFLSITVLFFACKSPPPEVVRVIEVEPPVIEVVYEEPEPEIEILEPIFEISSIVILQADLVVTEFETILKITNPNVFALDLSSLTYELFGNGFSWAKGAGKNILHVPALSSIETKFIFEMNFINMRRQLLDDVIALRQVRYRFFGKAEVQPVLPSAPPFIINYDCAGLSDVKKNYFVKR